jgi:hypothetical protein
MIRDMYEALSYSCMRTSATSLGGLKLENGLGVRIHAGDLEREDGEIGDQRQIHKHYLSLSLSLSLSHTHTNTHTRTHA